MRIHELGEQGLLKRLQSFCPAHIVGDDAALVTVSDGYQLVVTTDVLVDGVHFSWGVANPNVYTTSPYDAGWRAAAANLSDIAAMGGMPLGITVGLSVPPDLPVTDIEDFYRGLDACLRPFNTPIVGGDVCRSSVMTVAIAAYGQVLPSHAICRHTAQPGDVIWVTGYHGSSRAGLEWLITHDVQTHDVQTHDVQTHDVQTNNSFPPASPHGAETMTAKDYDVLINAHQRPQPRLDVVDAIYQLRQQFPQQFPQQFRQQFHQQFHQQRTQQFHQQFRQQFHQQFHQQRTQPLRPPLRQPGEQPAHSVEEPTIRLSGMDSSDGLADAVLQICRASGIGASLDRSAIPIAPEVLQWRSPEQSLNWALYGGEDFELVLCCEEAIAQSLIKAINSSARIIGRVTTAKDIVLTDSSGKLPDERLEFEHGFQHF